MNASQSTTDILINTYGPLMTIADLANLLDRSVEGLRVSLSQKECAVTKQLAASKIKFGRRVYFCTLDVAAVVIGNPTN